MKRAILLILTAITALSTATHIGLTFYFANKEMEMSIHGHIAMGLGIFFTYCIGGGLMALLFFSNRHGHDQRVHDSTKGKDNAL